MNKEDWTEADIDDPYRKCEIDDILYHEEFGSTCEICDIWICDNCWLDHLKETGHVRKGKRNACEVSPKTHS